MKWCIKSTPSYKEPPSVLCLSRDVPVAYAALLQTHLFFNYYFSLRYFLKVRPVEAAAEGWAAGDSFACYKMVQISSSSHHNTCTQQCPKGRASLPV